MMQLDDFGVVLKIVQRRIYLKEDLRAHINVDDGDLVKLIPTVLLGEKVLVLKRVED